MASIIELENDAATPITSFDFGVVDAGANDQAKFFLKNIGDQPATSVRVYFERIAQNDGFDFPLMAQDIGGNPDTFEAGPLVFGTVLAGISTAFWVKVTVPGGTTPAGNPRQFNTVVEYSGT